MTMNKLDIRSNYTLAVLSVLAILGFILVENSKVYTTQDWYIEKLQAATLMKKAEEYLKNLRIEKAIFIDNINDPNETGLIEQEYSQISTGRGSLPVKLSTTNPNFAALIVELLKDLNVQKGDVVAVCMTGSFPALNIAMYSALQTLEIKPIFISSTTSSTWGANNPDFTWLDMENGLYKSGYFKFRSVAASIGGNEDIGQSLSIKGRQLALQAIYRNDLEFINGKNLQENVKKRMNLFEKHSHGKPIKVFINIGGGVASLGSGANGNAIHSGINKKFLISKLPDKKGVVLEMFNQGIPVIHLLRIENLMKKYKLPVNPVPLPEIGYGYLYKVKKYNTTTVAIVSLILLASVIFVIIFNKKGHKLGSEILGNINNNVLKL
ncbi:MAG: poly-gamma-glutamate system protein [Bacteroidota bacterium]